MKNPLDLTPQESAAVATISNDLATMESQVVAAKTTPHLSALALKEIDAMALTLSGVRLKTNLLVAAVERSQVPIMVPAPDPVPVPAPKAVVAEPPPATVVVGGTKTTP